MRGIILPAFLVLFLCCGALGTNLQLPPGTSALSEGIQFWWGIAKHIVVTDQSEPRKIRVFAATLPRTGSSSLEVALETLGYNAMHGAEHMAHAHAVRDADAGVFDHSFRRISGSFSFILIWQVAGRWMTWCRIWSSSVSTLQGWI